MPVQARSRRTGAVDLHHTPSRAKIRDSSLPRCAGHGAAAVRDAITGQIGTLPEQLRRSLTWDQGGEMAQHAQLKIDAGIDVYFCDPQSPWQRPSNENTNDLLRQYFPRAPTCAAGPARSSRPSSPHSTPDRARH
jgi:IS30 family transposase